jgi:hypothetical protein
MKYSIEGWEVALIILLVPVVFTLGFIVGGGR